MADETPPDETSPDQTSPGGIAPDEVGTDPAAEATGATPGPDDAAAPPHTVDVGPAGPVDLAAAPTGALPPPSPAPGAAGSPSAGWYPDPAGTRPDILRYWDGSAWSDTWTQGEKAKATYKEKYKRRFGWTLVAVAVANSLTALLRLQSLPPIAGNAAIGFGVLLGAVIGLLGGAALWTLAVALFPGPKLPDDAPRRPAWRRPTMWALLTCLVAAPLVTWSFARPVPLPEMVVSSPADGCHAFMDTILTGAKNKVSDARLATYLSQLHDAALAHDPQLAADLAPVTDHITTADMQAATKSILTRCLTDGDMTQEQLTTWLSQLKAASTG